MVYTMHPPDELMVGVFLPSMRSLVSKRLRIEGYSQGAISNMLGVTQASVSIYLSDGTDKAYERLSELSLSRGEADRYAHLLSEDLKRNPVYAVGTLTSLWIQLLGRGLACTAHRKMFPSLTDCRVCIQAFAQMDPERSRVVEQVAEAVREIEASPTFASVMPEVSVNIAYLEGDSDSLDAVVAIPGRIVRVKNSAKAMSTPEFGASRHLAEILLVARRRIPEHRAVINLRYDGKMAEVIKMLQLRVLRMGGSYPKEGSADPIVGALSSKLTRARKPFDVVLDSGGNGIEPSLYVFGKSATELARFAIRMSVLHNRPDRP
jgi:XRE family transcriptional regulator, thiamine biosynthesis regulator